MEGAGTLGYLQLRFTLYALPNPAEAIEATSYLPGLLLAAANPFSIRTADCGSFLGVYCFAI